VNLKFNATRALLLIGQGQAMALASVTTESAKYAKIMNILHKIPGLENLAWDFNMQQARLLHSSLLCLECFIIAWVNTRVWEPVPLDEKEENSSSQSLLANEEGMRHASTAAA